MQSTRKGIIAAGTWTLDRVKIIDAWPLEEHLAVITGTDECGGGSAHNLGVDIRKLDSTMPVTGIGLLGVDSDAEFLLSKLQAAGIDTSQMHQTPDASTAFTDVITDSRNGKRTFFHHRGANDLLHPSHFDLSRSSARVLHLGLLGVHATMDNVCHCDGQEYGNGWQLVLQKARALGIHTNLELVSIAPDEIRRIAIPCLPYVDSLVVNEYELGALAEVVTEDENGQVQQDKCIAAASFVLERYGLALVVVHYPQGAIAVTDAGEVVHRLSFYIDPSEIVSTVGAGDAFAAGMLYALHEGWSTTDALELAHATALVSLRSATTVGAVVSVAECLTIARNLS